MPNGHVRAAAPGLPAAQTTSADPMLDIITRWRDALDRFNAASVGPDHDDSASAELAAATWRPIFDEMMAGAPHTATHAGALAAIELVARDIEDSTEPWHGPFLASAVAFLRRPEPKQCGAAAADTAPYAAKAFDGPGYYVFDGHEHPMLARDGRVWRVEERLCPPLPPGEVLYEIYAVGGSSDELALILPPPTFDAAMPRSLGETIQATAAQDAAP